MKFRYGIHPPSYALGRNEQYYSKMAAQGWFLKKRGMWLSRFEAGEPVQMRYRVEIGAPATIDGPALPAEQLDLYAQCGWTLAASEGMLYLFSAPADSEAPEPYADPAEQAPSLKALRRRYLLNFVGMVLQLVIFGLLGSYRHSLGATLAQGLVEQTAQLILLVVLLVGLWGYELHAGLSLHLLYRRMRKGIPLDHNPQPSRRGIVWGIWGAVLAVVLVLCGIQYRSSTDVPLPDGPEGPWLLLSDLGMEDPRTVMIYSDRENRLKTETSLLARQLESWETTEKSWCATKTLELKNEEMAQFYARQLLELGIFAPPESYQQVEAPGLDLAFYVPGGLEVVAVLGNRVCYIQCPLSEAQAKILEALPQVLARPWPENQD